MITHQSFRGRFGLLQALFISVIIGMLGFFSCGKTHTPKTGSDHPGTFYTIEKKYVNSQLDGYNMYLPPSYSTQSEAFPLIVFLQGGLGVGGKVSAIFQWELPKELKETTELTSELHQLKLNTFIYVMPHISRGEYYHNVEAIRQLLDEVVEQYNVNKNRIYLTGLSRGGNGTWGLASEIPDRFAAIIPIAGTASGVSDYEALTNLPIWAVHNVDDEVVDHSRTQKVVQRIEHLSGNKFHQTQTIATTDYLNHDQIFTSGENKINNHDAWTEVYNEVTFYKWLLRFEKD